jgi:hypothetical protein
MGYTFIRVTSPISKINPRVIIAVPIICLQKNSYSKDGISRAGLRTWWPLGHCRQCPPPISSRGPSPNGNVCGCKTVTAIHFWSRTRTWMSLFSVYIRHFNSWLQSCILSLNVLLLNGMVDCQAGHLLE